ncbi:succinyldiaminopimelate transaminase [Egicoccus halophilus]|uniref:LL-diaminopimelate aminotransferase n=1 Tax=Egicoccus halophilus TaxID=1670830 RepID=A0A8J3EXT3_9ACTN|nr:succinyldiaminopimelate transaminase [Egicoccus halophilus]GGI06404.1 LL-diaminopimelate aminotransferase [Egicoccus halophilus]
MATSNPALDELGGYPLARLQELANALRADGGVLADFAIGDPDEPTPPFIRDALVDAVGPVSRYPTAAGQPALRTAVAGWLRSRHGVEVDPDVHVLPSAGSKEAIFHLPLAVLDPHGARRGVVWGDPGYPVYGRGALFAGGVSDPVTLTAADGWRLDLGTLDADRLRAACLAWVNYPHNPTGASVDVDYYRDQVAHAREHGLLLASDECYQEIWFGERPPPSVLEACDGDFTDVLAFVSLSKRSGMTGYRSGAIVGDPELIRRLRLLRPNIGTASPDFVQVAATTAWRDQTHVDARRAVFAAKRDVVLGFLRDAGIEISGSEATFYVWFRAPGGDDAAYAEALLAERIVASPGRAFGPAGAGWLRLALVPTVQGCREAVDRWAAAIDAGRLPV